jgi:ribonucleoside-diphosphate reductase beta chain
MSKYLNITNGDRDTKFPIQHTELWDFFKKQQSKIWTAEEVSLGDDTLDGIPESEVIILKNLLAFFGVSDKLVQDNLADEIIKEFSCIEEIKSNYIYQAYIEDVHSETYSRLIDQLITDDKEKDEMFRAMETNPIVKSKVKWAEKWLKNGTLIERVVAFSLVEGLFFSSTFAFLMFFRKQYPKLAGLGQANELILTDEVLHMQFGINMHEKYIKQEYKIPKETIKEMILDCYESEKDFVNSIYGDNQIIGLPKERMLTYIKYVTDSLLGYYGIDMVFNVQQPLDHMSAFSIVERQNFFEVKSGEYNRLVGIGGNLYDDEF